MCILHLATDTENPVIFGVPSDIVQSTDPNKATAAVTWTPPTASDNSGLVSLTSSHDPGDNFSIATTTVTYTAVDSSNNIVTSSFTITVTGRFTNIDRILDQVQGLTLGNT